MFCTSASPLCNLQSIADSSSSRLPVSLLPEKEYILYCTYRSREAYILLAQVIRYSFVLIYYNDQPEIRWGNIYMKILSSLPEQKVSAIFAEINCNQNFPQS